MKLLESKVALVTGAAGGLGDAIVCALRDQGAIVTATDLVACETSPGIVALDVTDMNSIRATAEQFPQLDILVNCAGIIRRQKEEFAAEPFARVVDVNLTGTMRVCSAFHSALSKRSGCIVNIASMLSFFGSSEVPAYSSSKGGIVQLTKSLAIAWAAEGIRVNAVAPGWIRTALTEPLAQDPQKNAAIVQRTPLKRWGTAEEVAGAVMFLCSDTARFITGVVLPVDGGYSAS